MKSLRSRAAAAVAALTDELYQSSRAYTQSGELDPFVLLAGPELLRRPWLGQYFNLAMLDEIYTAMRGREELYEQMHDLLALLGLMFNPITPEQQRAASQLLSREYGLDILDRYIVDMT